MKVKLSFKENKCAITRELTDKAIGRESEFYHKVKKELQKQGHDVIKKLVQKDGHMYGDGYQYYIRERKWKWCLVDPRYCLEQIHRTFNKDRVAFLQLHQGENW